MRYALPVLLLWHLAVPPTSDARANRERLAFELTGSCREPYESLTSFLSALEGVHQVDLASIPGHLLVDIDRQALSPRRVTEIVRQRLDATGCRATTMESCISASSPRPIAESTEPLSQPSHR